MRIVRGIKVHQAGELFPWVEDDAWPAFVDSVRQGAESGTLDKIVLFEGQILDGRNRWVALQEIGRDPHEFTVDMTDCIENPAIYSVNKNLNGRRQLDKPQQRTVIAAKMADLAVGSNQRKSKVETDSPTATAKVGTSVAEAARIMNVSESSVNRMKPILKAASAEVVRALETCEISTSLAKKVVEAIPEKSKQTEAMKAGKEVVEKEVAKAEVSLKNSVLPGSTVENKKTTQAEIAKIEAGEDPPKKDRFDAIVEQMSDTDLITLIDRAFKARKAVAEHFEFVVVDNAMIAEVVDTWNRIMGQETKVTKKRAGVIRARLRTKQWNEDWQNALAKLSTSDFANGENDRGWVADIDFFLRPDTVTKILEGKYDKSRKESRGRFKSTVTDGDV